MFSKTTFKKQNRIKAGKTQVGVYLSNMPLAKKIKAFFKDMFDRHFEDPNAGFQFSHLSGRILREIES